MFVQREPIVTILAVSLRSTILLFPLLFVVVTMTGLVSSPVVFRLVAPDFRYANEIENDDHK